MKYRKNNESINKYTAGLLDADGNIHLTVTDSQTSSNIRSVRVQFTGERKDKVVETLLNLHDHYQMGRMEYPNTRTNIVNWTLNGQEAINFLTVIKKHLVIKGQHAERTINLWYRLKDRTSTVKALARWRRLSRDSTGPIHHKKHLTWAWLAGYIDGDGHISIPKKRIEFQSNLRDIAAYELIQHSLGRPYRINYKPSIQQDIIRIDLSFTKEHTAFMKGTGVKILRHLRMKRWALEQVFAAHNKQLKPTSRD